MNFSIVLRLTFQQLSQDFFRRRMSFLLFAREDFYHRVEVHPTPTVSDGGGGTHLVVLISAASHHEALQIAARLPTTAAVATLNVGVPFDSVGPTTIAASVVGSRLASQPPPLRPPPLVPSPATSPPPSSLPTTLPSVASGQTAGSEPPLAPATVVLIAGLGTVVVCLLLLIVKLFCSAFCAEMGSQHKQRRHAKEREARAAASEYKRSSSFHKSMRAAASLNVEQAVRTEKSKERAKGGPRGGRSMCRTQSGAKIGVTAVSATACAMHTLPAARTATLPAGSAAPKDRLSKEGMQSPKSDDDIDEYIRQLEESDRAHHTYVSELEQAPPCTEGGHEGNVPASRLGAAATLYQSNYASAAYQSNHGGVEGLVAGAPAAESAAFALQPTRSTAKLMSLAAHIDRMESRRRPSAESLRRPSAESLPTTPTKTRISHDELIPHAPPEAPGSGSRYTHRIHRARDANRKSLTQSLSAARLEGAPAEALPLEGVESPTRAQYQFVETHANNMSPVHEGLSAAATSDESPTSTDASGGEEGPFGRV